MSADNNEVYPIETGEGLQQNEGYPEHHSGRRRREMRDSHHKKGRAWYRGMKDERLARGPLKLGLGRHC